MGGPSGTPVASITPAIAWISASVAGLPANGPLEPNAVTSQTIAEGGGCISAAGPKASASTSEESRMTSLFAASCATRPASAVPVTRLCLPAANWSRQPHFGCAKPPVSAASTNTTVAPSCASSDPATEAPMRAPASSTRTPSSGARPPCAVAALTPASTRVL